MSSDSLTISQQADGLSLSGALTLDSLSSGHRSTIAGLRSGGDVARLDLSGLERVDSLGASLLVEVLAAREASGNPLEVTDPPDGPARLIEAVRAAREKTEAGTGGAPKGRSLHQRIEGLGKATLDLGTEAREMIGFFGALVIGIGSGLARPWTLKWTALVHHMQATGVNALPIVGLLSFLIGVVLAYQGAEQLARFGQEILVVNLLAISILREIGILMTAIIIAGRSGSAFTAQIGTMKVRQEIDAMRVIGLDPMQTLVVPRVLALILTLPLLGVYAALVGLFGGAVASLLVLGISFDAFIEQLRTAFGPWSFWVGVIKAPVFALIIGMVGCFQGLQVSGSAESVGKLTTKSVVQGIFLVIVIDAIFSIAFQIIGV